MQIDEFIEATTRLETYYGKEFTTEQRQIMFEELKEFTVERYRMLISKCLKTCKYMPKIADIIDANIGLVAQSSEEESRKVYPCKKCEGKGYVVYTKFETSGGVRIPYSYAARCMCENAKYANSKIPTYAEVGVQIGTKMDQVNDIHRSIEQIKNDLVKKMSI